VKDNDAKEENGQLETETEARERWPMIPNVLLAGTGVMAFVIVYFAYFAAYIG
jgi:hypothetical protein